MLAKEDFLGHVEEKIDKRTEEGQDAKIDREKKVDSLKNRKMDEDPEKMN